MESTKNTSSDFGNIKPVIANDYYATIMSGCDPEEYLEHIRTLMHPVPIKDKYPGSLQQKDVVVKVNQEEEDSTLNGTKGVICGVVSLGEGMPTLSNDSGEKVMFMYFVKWESFPVPVLVSDYKVEKINEPNT